VSLAERADLVARLTLDSRGFVQGVSGATSKLKGMEGTLGRIGKQAGTGLKTAGANLAKIGAVAGGFVAFNVQQGIHSLAELEDATTSVDGAIKQMGLTGKVTSGQIAGWANEIEASVQAAFDDKEITAATASLIRYGKLTPQNIKPAMVVMTDLAAKTGDVGSASSLLAKALADPTKAAGKLARVGIILTKEQQKQIEKMDKAGDAAGAQTVLLDALAKSTKGAAAASKGPFNDALNTMRDSVEDVQRVLGVGFLPVISKVATKIKELAQDPEFMKRVAKFGQDLAGGFDKAVEFAGQIPWGLIGSSLETAGKGAKAIFDAFTMLPPWVQQAVLTGWGLNKLTGGALGSIVGELGKGLIKGVLGMNAGVVNITAGTVNGAGGVSGGGGGGVRNLVGGGIAAATVVQGAQDAATLINGIQGVQSAQTPQQVSQIMKDAINGTVIKAPGVEQALGFLTNMIDQRFPPESNDPKSGALSPTERDELHKQTAKLSSIDIRAEAVKERLARVAASTSETTRAVRAIPPPKTTVDVTTNVRVSVTANSITRTMQQTGTFTAAHVGAYNRAGGLLS
jgi:hypothetical protein